MSAQPMAVLPPLTPSMSFVEASERVLKPRRALITLGFWSVACSHVERDRQVYAHLRDEVYGLEQGDSNAWSASFCRFMVVEDGPQIAPDAMAVPQHASAGVTHGPGYLSGRPMPAAELGS